jgi:hypothetical protein
MYPNLSSLFTAEILSNYWTRVVVEPLTLEEMTSVLIYKFPSISSLIPKFIGEYLLFYCYI